MFIVLWELIHVHERSSWSYLAEIVTLVYTHMLFLFFLFFFFSFFCGENVAQSPSRRVVVPIRLISRSGAQICILHLVFMFFSMVARILAGSSWLHRSESCRKLVSYKAGTGAEFDQWK